MRGELAGRCKRRNLDFVRIRFEKGHPVTCAESAFDVDLVLARGLEASGENDNGLVILPG